MDTDLSEDLDKQLQILEAHKAKLSKQIKQGELKRAQEEVLELMERKHKLEQKPKSVEGRIRKDVKLKKNVDGDKGMRFDEIGLSKLIRDSKTVKNKFNNNNDSTSDNDGDSDEVTNVRDLTSI